MAQSIVAPSLIPNETIQAYCKKWGICEFALFGSVLRDDFNENSDIDVLVTFCQGIEYTLADLIAMGDELEMLFGRKVDLIDRYTVENSRNYLRRNIILQSMQVIYAE
jgi:predicted nucleotidyltransferase